MPIPKHWKKEAQRNGRTDIHKVKANKYHPNLPTQSFRLQKEGNNSQEPVLFSSQDHLKTKMADLQVKTYCTSSSVEAYRLRGETLVTLLKSYQPRLSWVYKMYILLSSEQFVCCQRSFQQDLPNFVYPDFTIKASSFNCWLSMSLSAIWKLM